MLVHPNNPTGSYIKPAEAEALNGICAERRLALVADEVFLDFAHDGVTRSTFAGGWPTVHGAEARATQIGGPAALTFTLSGLSKISGLPQMKFAWIAVGGSDDLAADAMARLELIADTYLSMNAPIQHAAPVLFAQRHEFQRQLMQRIRANLGELDRQLATQRVCERVQIEGGWYAVLRAPVTRSDEELAIELLEKKSALVHPGHFYDFPADGYLVISLIAQEKEFREGLQRLVEFVICNL
jgi:aspartate/methionine/tyrosine aminotransferase